MVHPSRGRRADHLGMTASVVRFTLGALLLLALAPSVALGDRTFAKRFGTNDLGNIAAAGNTLRR
jgi:hypothetical protein